MKQKNRLRLMTEGYIIGFIFSIIGYNIGRVITKSFADNIITAIIGFILSISLGIALALFIGGLYLFIRTRGVNKK